MSYIASRFLLGADPETCLIVEQAWKSRRKVRTLDDLLGISLEPSVKPVKCVVDHFSPGWGELGDDKLIKAWILYNAHKTEQTPETERLWAPTLDTFGKKFRWKLYTKLVKWGVI